MAVSDRHEFNWKKHVRFFKMCLQVVPGRYASMDTTRMTVAFFAISGLDMLDQMDAIEKDRQKMIDWVYSLQYLPNASRSNEGQCGFRGSSTAGRPYDPKESSSNPVAHDSGHIAGTYSALLSLLVLGDDLSKVDRPAIAAGLRELQLLDGSFSPTPEGGENDMRFVYCAACISYVLDDWSGIDRQKVIEYIKESFTYEGAFAQGPGLEAHGGTTFCAVAALVLMGCLNEVLSLSQLDRLKRWCLLRQQSGFQGRPNKPVDTCYSFWVGGTLQLLDVFQYSNNLFNRGFLEETEDLTVGGFAKWPDNSPDPLHAYFGVCGLSLMSEPGILKMDAALNISERSAARLQDIHSRWRDSPDGSTSPLLRLQHTAFLKHCLMALPSEAATADASRLTVAYFCLCGLDLLNHLDVLSLQERSLIADWIYSLQRPLPAKGSATDVHSKVGFCGSSTIDSNTSLSDHTHIVMTYSALCCLATVGDDLSRLDAGGILRGLGKLQRSDGSFQANMVENSEVEIKFAYCAVCVCYILNDFTHINIDHLVEYICSCQTYEGGFGQGPGLEAHGGSTYCAVASLALLGRLSVLSVESTDGLRRWCLQKQRNGFQGRTNKTPECSYSFWIGAALQMIGALKTSNMEANTDFLLSLQSSSGGFIAKPSTSLPDPMQTYFSLGALSLLGHEGVSPLNVTLCVSHRAANLIQTLLKLKQWT